MAQFTREDVLKLARLARIELDDTEIDLFTAEFGAILEYVEQLQAVDVEGLEPTHQVSGLKNVMRNDMIVDYGYQTPDLLTNVPQVENNLIKVKRMVG